MKLLINVYIHLCFIVNAYKFLYVRLGKYLLTCNCVRYKGCYNLTCITEKRIYSLLGVIFVPNYSLDTGLYSLVLISGCDSKRGYSEASVWVAILPLIVQIDKYNKNENSGCPMKFIA